MYLTESELSAIKRQIKSGTAQDLELWWDQVQSGELKQIFSLPWISFHLEEHAVKLAIDSGEPTVLFCFENVSEVFKSAQVKLRQLARKHNGQLSNHRWLNETRWVPFTHVQFGDNCHLFHLYGDYTTDVSEILHPRLIAVCPPDLRQQIARWTVEPGSKFLYADFCGQLNPPEFEALTRHVNVGDHVAWTTLAYLRQPGAICEEIRHELARNGLTTKANGVPLTSCINKAIRRELAARGLTANTLAAIPYQSNRAPMFYSAFNVT